MVRSQWGDDVTVNNLFCPNWAETTLGSDVNVVADIHGIKGDVCLATIVPGKQLVRIEGTLPEAARSSNRITLLGVTMTGRPPVVSLKLHDASFVMVHGPLDFDQMSSMIEVCSGVAAASTGFVRNGFAHKASVEWQPALVKLHGCVHANVPIIHGDVNSTDVLKQIWTTCGPIGLLMSGISCQPYSSGGAQSGGNDDRANTLPAVLRMMHLLQIPVLVIECVTQAQTNTYVRQHIRRLHEELQCHINELVTRLEDCWTANRHRWWLVASTAAYGPVPLAPMPSGNRMVVRDIMPYVKEWPWHEEKQLILTDSEMDSFNKYGPIRKHMLKWDAKAPTALHSWGNQLGPCECGCRNTGFSDALLSSRGLFAQIVPTKKTSGNTIQYRHLHCREVALLNGFLPEQSWSANERLNLCAVGQLASPLQSIWISGCIMRHIQTIIGIAQTVDPLTQLQELKRDLLTQASKMFPMTTEPATRNLVLILQDDTNAQVTTEICLSKPVTVLDFLRLESEFQKQDLSHCLLKDATTQTILEYESLLSSGKYILFAADAQPIRPTCPDESQTSVAVEEALPLELLPDVFTQEATSASAPLPNLVSTPTAMSLNAEQLLNMLPPLISDAVLCQIMRSHTVPHYERAQILLNQEHLWADDELVWHATHKIAACGRTDVIWLDPLLATTWSQQDTISSIQAWFLQLNSSVNWILTAILHDGHWTPLVLIRKNNQLNVHVWELDEKPLANVQHLSSQLCKAWSLEAFTLLCTRRSFGQLCCGAATIAYFDHMLNHVDLPTDEIGLQSFHVVCKNAFKAACVQTEVCPKPWCWGAGADDHSMLCAILKLHGVPDTQANSRAKLVMQSLGRDAVQAALSGGTPWKSLKVLANQHAPPVQLVLPDEQALQHQNRSQGKRSKGQRSSNSTKQLPAAVADLDPTKLVLAEGSFRVGSDEPISQLSLSQVSPLTSGVALTSFNDALPFLKSGTLLSTKGLALLILNHPQDLPTTLQWNTLRFAAKCALNGEPVLLTGALVQLGRQQVYQYCKSDGVQPQTLPVACVRLTVYKDMWDGSWESFQEQPVKLILQQLLPLQTCLEDDCDCSKWHPAIDVETQDVVLDVFRRHYYNDSGKTVPGPKASHYGVMIRYVKDQEKALLSLSGVDGIFMEPRTPDANSPSDEFQVVWIQDSFQNLQHTARCEPSSLGLARNGPKLGIRVFASDFQSTFEKLRPSALFLAPGRRTNWHCGPWPFGTDRKQLARIFKDWKWDARPLQPAHQAMDGLMWHVQALTDPVESVWHMKHGQVVITRCPEEKEKAVAPEVVAQPRTKQLCQIPGNVPGSVDLLQVHDPWKKTVRQAIPTQPTDVHRHLDDIESRIEKSVLAKLPQDRMDTDERDNRITALEQQIAAITDRQTSLETVVQDNHKQNQVQVQNLQSQMMAQLEVQGKTMQGMLDDQLHKLEAVLVRRSRSRERHL